MRAFDAYGTFTAFRIIRQLCGKNPSVSSAKR